MLVRQDPSLPLKLITDTSTTGVGAALLHYMPDGTEQPVMYVLRALTATERRYAQVKREATGVQYGISTEKESISVLKRKEISTKRKRFHNFLFGRLFTLTMDNLALSRILS